MPRSMRIAVVASALTGCLVDFPLPAGSDTTGATAADGAITSNQSGEDTAGAEPSDEKWIRVAAIAGRSVSEGIPDAAETARFDLVVAAPERATTWAGSDESSWANLRALNPGIRLFISVQNAANYAPYEGFGDGWDWITANHGTGSSDRWTAIGVNNPTSYLRWSTHYAMTLEPASWRAYHFDSVRAGLTDQLGPEALAHLDGIYILADSGYAYPWPEEWEAEISPGVLEPDYPADYHDGTSYDEAKYRASFDRYLDEAIAFFESQAPPLAVALGFSGLHTLDHWERLDSRSQPVTLAFTNAGLLQQWGGTYNVTNFRNKFEMIQNLRHTGLIHGNQGRAADIPGEGLAKMDALATTAPGEGSTLMTGWEALWFALCGHMAAIDVTRSDQYFYFSVWGFTEFHWFDEYDPEFLHLGEPLGSAFELEDATMREFEDGWVALNPTQGDLSNVPVPSGSARVITHEELHSPELTPLVTSFDLPLHRGVVLLRDGATLGR